MLGAMDPRLTVHSVGLFWPCSREASKVDFSPLLSAPAGSSLPAVPGLCMAAAVPVSLSLPADRRLPVGFT